MSSNVKKLTFCALMAALTAVCAQLTIPLPGGVPLTMQIFAVALTGYLLGPKYGAIAMLVYLLLGAVGAPVFSSFRGGFYVLVGKTGGYLWSYPAMAALCGCSALGKGKVLRWFWGVPGLLLCHLCGVLQIYLMTGGAFLPLAMAYSIPFLPKDLFSVAAAALLAQRLHPLLDRYLLAGVKRTRNAD